MAMERWEQTQRQKGNIAGAEIARVLLDQFGDEPLSSAAAPASNAAPVVEAKPVVQTFSRDQLILPETQIPQYVSEVLQRAEEAGLTFFEPYHLSGITLTQDSNVEGWTKKPENWYWEQIRNGKVSQDAPKLPGSWVLIDRTQRPNYRAGKQLHENDPLGPFLARLRKDKKIKNIKGIPNISRFGISHDELTTIVLPELARVLGVDKSQVRLPREIEFNIMGNLKHPEWGETNTWEWFDDKFADDYRLLGGLSDNGGLADVHDGWSDRRNGLIGFRPLVVLSPKA